MPILQAALLEIGRLGTDAAGGVLLARLADVNQLGRAETALALGAVGGKKILARLIGALLDRDPWLRFCAYRALKALSGQDFCCDWLYGPEATIRRTTRKWKDWWRARYQAAR